MACCNAIIGNACVNSDDATDQPTIFLVHASVMNAVYENPLVSGRT